MSTPAIMRIDPELIPILAASRVEGNNLYLPGETLERSLYQRVDKVIKALGGAWKGGKIRAHVFDYCPADALENAVQTGVFTNEKVEYQFFETPRPVALRMVDLAGLGDMRPRGNILEPSAGKGAIARVVRDEMPEGANLYVNELNPRMCDSLAEEGFSFLLDRAGHDFLGIHVSGGFDRILQNPPFAKRQDAAHVLYAFMCLERGGKLVSVMSASVKFRRDAEYEQVRRMVADTGGIIEDLPPGSFRSSGTDVNAVLVTIHR